MEQVNCVLVTDTYVIVSALINEYLCVHVNFLILRRPIKYNFIVQILKLY